MKKFPPIYLLICLLAFPQLGETIYTPALPDVAHDLMVSNNLAQWTLSIFFVGFAVGVFFWGRVSDRHGRRPTMLIGLLVYSLASLVCLLAPTIHWLLLARFWQAFGASVGSVVTQTIMRESFPEHRRNQLFALIGSVLSLSPAIGPVIGGYIADWFSWEINFLALLIIGLLLILLVWRQLPETHDAKNWQRIRVPQVMWRMLCDPKVMGSAFVIGGLHGVLYGYYAEAPFLFIQLLHYTPSHYGWLGLFVALPSALGALMARRLHEYLNYQHIMRFGLLLTVLGSALMTSFALLGWITAAHIPWAAVGIIAPTVIIIFGFGMTIPACLSNALLAYHDVLGTAGSVFGLYYYIMISVFTGIMAWIHNGTAIPMPLYFLTLCTAMLLVHRLTIEVVET